MIAIDDALAAYAARLRILPTERIDTRRALDRVLAAPAPYADDLPRFDQSAMDGYALCAADSTAADEDRPARLQVVATVAAGAGRLPMLRRGQAARIFTGAPLPPGADCMVPQERVARDGDNMLLHAPVASGANLRRRGEEARAGSPLAVAGQRIGPGLLGALVNAGVRDVLVTRRPRIRVLVTGDELRALDQPLKPGQIVDSNGPMVRALLQRWGLSIPAPRRVRDSAAAFRDALGKALDAADLVLTCGGASVGDRDHLRDAAAALGVDTVFWRVAQKPAKPLFFGLRDRTALLGLPGNPGAVLVSMVVHVRHAIDCLEGQTDAGVRWMPGRLVEPVERELRRDRLMRMRLSHDDKGAVTLNPLPKQDSHMLGNLADARVLVRVPMGDGIATTGTLLRWTPLPR